MEPGTPSGPSQVGMLSSTEGYLGQALYLDEFFLDGQGHGVLGAFWLEERQQQLLVAHKFLGKGGLDRFGGSLQPATCGGGQSEHLKRLPAAGRQKVGVPTSLMPLARPPLALLAEGVKERKWALTTAVGLQGHLSDQGQLSEGGHDAGVELLSFLEQALRCVGEFGTRDSLVREDLDGVVARGLQWRVTRVRGLLKPSHPQASSPLSYCSWASLPFLQQALLPLQ